MAISEELRSIFINQRLTNAVLLIDYLALESGPAAVEVDLQQGAERAMRRKFMGKIVDTMQHVGAEIQRRQGCIPAEARDSLELECQKALHSLMVTEQ